MTTLKMTRNKRGEFTKKSHEINLALDYIVMSHVKQIIDLKVSVKRLSLAVWAIVIYLSANVLINTEFFANLIK